MYDVAVRFIVAVIVLSVLWTLLTEASFNSWLVGGPVVVVASLVAVRLSPRNGFRCSVFGMLAFVPHFVRSSVVGGVDIAWRSMHPRLPIDPQMIDYELRLPAGTARTFFMNVVNLLPGTVSADVGDDVLTVHVMNVNQPMQQELASLEEAVAKLFAIHLQRLEVQGERTS